MNRCDNMRWPRRRGTLLALRWSADARRQAQSALEGLTAHFDPAPCTCWDALVRDLSLGWDAPPGTFWDFTFQIPLLLAFLHHRDTTDFFLTR